MHLSAQLVTEDLQRVCLAPYRIKVADAVAVAAAVTVYAAVAAAPLKVHIIVGAEPARGLVPVQYGNSLYFLHTASPSHVVGYCCIYFIITHLSEFVIGF